MFDHHVHSTFSIDCRVPMDLSCQAAIAAGVTEIAFTDHVDHEPADPGHGFYRYEAYRAAIEDARRRFGDRLTILTGAEVDFNPRISAQVEAFLASTEFDFVIGSVHYDLDGELIYPRTFTGRSLDDVFRPYFADVLAAVETGWFDSIGHLDLPKRYAPGTHRTYDPLAFRDLLRPIFAAMVARGVAFEINTSGMRQVPRTSMPGPAVVRWYVEAGGRLVTTGTDSHAVRTVGAGLGTTLAMLGLCGIAEVQSFRGRTRTPVPISQLVPVAHGPA
ncbi:MAG: histidinol-phosphatase HisJ family protein [Chloroflexia bacterium]|nr:histidinol-phosphatase HisJ family protein [Chloroflexia bacterium]